MIRLAAPLVLTAILLCAELFGLPTAIRLGALVAMTAAWLGFAWFTLRPGQGAAMIREQSRLLDELRDFVGSEVQGSRTEIERTRDLIRDRSQNHLQCIGRWPYDPLPPVCCGMPSCRGSR